MIRVRGHCLRIGAPRWSARGEAGVRPRPGDDPRTVTASERFGAPAGVRRTVKYFVDTRPRAGAPGSGSWAAPPEAVMPSARAVRESRPREPEGDRAAGTAPGARRAQTRDRREDGERQIRLLVASPASRPASVAASVSASNAARPTPPTGGAAGSTTARARRRAPRPRIRPARPLPVGKGPAGVRPTSCPDHGDTRCRAGCPGRQPASGAVAVGQDAASPGAPCFRRSRRCATPNGGPHRPRALASSSLFIDERPSIPRLRASAYSWSFVGP